MSQTITTRPPEPAISPVDSTQILTNFIITLMAPMFLVAAGGDFSYARIAAAETINAYRAETQADLITVARIVAFGLATLGSLCLSMADDLPLPMVLRFRSNADSCDRSEHQNRRVLERSRNAQAAAQTQAAEQAQQAPVPKISPGYDEAALPSAAAETQSRATENFTQLTLPEPSIVTDEAKQHQEAWAARAANLAAETAANLPNLPPEERQGAMIWLDILKNSANRFMTGTTAPRPMPDDLAGLTASKRG